MENPSSPTYRNVCFLLLPISHFAISDFEKLHFFANFSPLSLFREFSEGIRRISAQNYSECAQEFYEAFDNFHAKSKVSSFVSFFFFSLQSAKMNSSQFSNRKVDLTRTTPPCLDTQFQVHYSKGETQESEAFFQDLRLRVPRLLEL